MDKEKSDLHDKISENVISKAFRYKEERVLSKNLELSYCNHILQIKTEKPTFAIRKTKVLVIEDLSGIIEIEFQGKKLEYKELWVKDRREDILNKKEAMARIFRSRGKRSVLNF